MGILLSQVFFPLKVELVKKADAPDECCQYFYEIYSMDGNKLGAGITIPVKKGESMPTLKSCVLSTLEPEAIIKILSPKQAVS